MFEVRPGVLKGTAIWILYRIWDGGLDIVAWFPHKKDAELARDAFNAHEKVACS